MTAILYDEVVAPGRPWGRIVEAGHVLSIVDLQGQQAVDFLCYDAVDPGDRYSATNTIKVQKSPYIGLGTILYSDRGKPLFTVVADTLGKHDTLYGCCSDANNRLRYGAPPGPNCYSNFREVLGRFGLGESAIVANINFFHARALCRRSFGGGRTRCFASRWPGGSQSRNARVGGAIELPASS